VAEPLDSPPEGAEPGPDDNEEPDTSRDFDQLRQLLVGTEQQRLRKLEDRVDRFAVTADAVGDVLAEAIADRTARDNQLARALTPTIETAITESVHRNPDPLADAIYPTLGPAIRKAISQALAGFLDTMNRAIDHSLSPRGLQWRFESWRTGVPYAHIVLRDSLVYQVEQVFLIHGETGLLLAHSVAEDAQSTAADLVSGMLTAIRDFVADSFASTDDGGLRRFTVGERVVLAEAGPRMVIAAVVRGHPPASLVPRLQNILETLHTQHRRHLQEFGGDTAPFSTATFMLEECLDRVLSTDQPASRSNAPRVAWAVVGLAALVLAVLAYQSLARWNRATALLVAEPGIVLLDADHGWRRSVLTGLRDPLSAEPAAMLAGAGINMTRVEERWQAYLSLEPEIIERRVRQVTRAPDTVTLTIEEGVLLASGAAEPSWLARAAAPIAGVDAVDLSGVELVPSPALEQSLAMVEEHRVLFAIGSAALDVASAQETLQAIADAYARVSALADIEGWQVELTMTGRTDATGPTERNALLSTRRSEVVRDALQTRGVAINRVRIMGLGVTEPLRANDAEQESTLNRSVSFALTLTPLPLPPR
jgi:outer membrane protein OmpA-like peptidoglycan-associated protein